MTRQLSFLTSPLFARQIVRPRGQIAGLCRPALAPCAPAPGGSRDRLRAGRSAASVPARPQRRHNPRTGAASPPDWRALRRRAGGWARRLSTAVTGRAPGARACVAARGSVAASRPVATSAPSWRPVAGRVALASQAQTFPGALRTARPGSAVSDPALAAPQAVAPVGAKPERPGRAMARPARRAPAPAGRWDPCRRRPWSPASPAWRRAASSPGQARGRSPARGPVRARRASPAATNAASPGRRARADPRGLPWRRLSGQSRQSGSSAI